jgi:GNAT superfamily N-acetyltransferase
MNAVPIERVGPDALAQYRTIPISFRVESVFRVAPAAGGLGGMILSEEPVEQPYVKDYDGDVAEGPLGWARRFDLSRWLILMAFDGTEAVGGAAVAFGSREVHMLGGRDDLAVLWDIRVRPDRRGQGIGSALFSRAAEWARQQGCTQLKAETQNVNVPACRFYAAQGCRLGTIDCCAYANSPRVAQEVMLCWCLDLQTTGGERKA